MQCEHAKGQLRSPPLTVAYSPHRTQARYICSNTNMSELRSNRGRVLIFESIQVAWPSCEVPRSGVGRARRDQEHT